MSISGSFALLMYPGDPWIPSDWMIDPNQATKVVQQLKGMGVKYFLVFADTLDHYRTIGTAIRAAGLQFFCDERWAFEGMVNEVGHFDANLYRQNRIEPFLLPLKREFNDSFIGLNFKEEPGYKYMLDLGLLRDCLSADPELHAMKVFHNLLAVNANGAALSGQSPQDAAGLKPNEFGMDCGTGDVRDLAKLIAMKNDYEPWVRTVSAIVRPDYLCTDFYPFDNGFENCPGASEYVLSETFKYTSLHARLNGSTPVAYLQNYRKGNAFANATSLRWSVSLALAFGIKEFANFISHSGGDKVGMLDSQNNQTEVGVEQQKTFQFFQYIQRELEAFRYHTFVDFSKGGPRFGYLVGWLPSDKIIAGEYLSLNNPMEAMVFFASRPIQGRVANESVGLSGWYRKIEHLDVDTGQWVEVGTVGKGKNGIELTLDKYPGALYRLNR